RRTSCSTRRVSSTPSKSRSSVSRFRGRRARASATPRPGCEGNETMVYDVLIVGGGSNGTGLARDLAKRGAKVLLCEKADFARGATGASSGMIHGGPRYLLSDVETTKHSCADSGYIQKIAPHIIFRVPFLVPVPTSNNYGKLG